MKESKHLVGSGSIDGRFLNYPMEGYLLNNVLDLYMEQNINLSCFKPEHSSAIAVMTTLSNNSAGSVLNKDFFQ